MKTIQVKWWCEKCAMYTTDEDSEHQARHEFETNRVANLERLRQLSYNDPANEEGDFSGASEDEDWGGR